MMLVKIVLGQKGWRHDLPIEVKQKYFELKGKRYNIYEEIYAKRDNSNDSKISIVGFKKYPIGLINSKDINGFETFDDLGELVELTDLRLTKYLSNEYAQEVYDTFEEISNDDPDLIKAIEDTEFDHKDDVLAKVKVMNIEEKILMDCKIYYKTVNGVDVEYLATPHKEYSYILDEDGNVIYDVDCGRMVKIGYGAHYSRD